jgi:hypothetical protein
MVHPLLSRQNSRHCSFWINLLEMGKSEGGGEESVASQSRPQKTRGRRHLTCALQLPRHAKNWSQAGKPAETITHRRSIQHTLLHSECNPPFLSTTWPIIANRRDREPGSMKLFFFVILVSFVVEFSCGWRCWICGWTGRARGGIIPAWRKNQRMKRGVRREPDPLSTAGRHGPNHQNVEMSGTPLC